LVSSYVPDAGDLIWLDFDPQAGHEQAGRRPALVLSSSQFNQRTALAFVCPVTSKIKGYTSEVLLPPGLPVYGAVLCSHMRSVDWDVRNPALIGKAPSDVLLAVRAVVATIAGIAR
jgi:mRNA interferase MazF